MNRFKRGLPGRAKKISSADRRRHQIERHDEKRQAEAEVPAATQEEAAAMIAAAEESVNPAEVPVATCPLCGQPIFAYDQAKHIVKNGKNVLVHVDC